MTKKQFTKAFLTFMVVLVFLFSFQNKPTPRAYYLQGDREMFLTIYRTNLKSIEAIRKSEIPVKEAAPLLDTINSIQNEIAHQINFQDSIYNSVNKSDTTKRH